MFDHLRFVNEKIAAHSPAGEFALELLMLNDDEWLGFRGIARAGLSAVQKQLSDARILLPEVEKRIDSASPAEKATLEGQRDSLRQEIARLLVNLGDCHLQI
jgi:hypothetical protein